jgi:hypothetical protein
MLYTGSYRQQVREKANNYKLLMLVFLASTMFLTVGAIAVHFAVSPAADRIGFPPAEWRSTPPQWIN